MSSFLQKLKGEGVVKKGEETKPASDGKSLGNMAKIELDVSQTANEVLLYAIIPGAKEEDIEVIVEGDSDVVTLRGIKSRPEDVFGAIHQDHEGQFLVEECLWGEFYRQVILPEKIDVSSSEAKYKDGVLIVKLPLLAASSNKTRLKVSKVEDGPIQVNS